MENPNGIKAVMPVLAEEYKTNKSLIADFNSVQTTYANTAPHIKVINAPDTATTLIGSLQYHFLTPSVKLQSIIHNN